MVQEQAATEVQDAPEGFRGAAEAPPESEAAPTTEGVESVEEVKEEPAAPKTWEDYEQTEGFTDLEEARKKTWLEEATPDIKRDAKSEAMREFDPHMQRQSAAIDGVATSAESLAQAGQSVLQKIRTAVKAGTLDADSLEDIATTNPAFSQFLNGRLFDVQALTNAGMDKALEILAKESGTPTIKEDMYIRLRNDPTMSNSEFAKAYLDRLTEARMGTRMKEGIEKATKPLKDEIEKLKADNNTLKGKKNTKEGPVDVATSGAGGVGPYHKMSAEQRAKLTPEQRDAASAKER